MTLALYICSRSSATASPPPSVSAGRTAAQPRSQRLKERQSAGQQYSSTAAHCRGLGDARSRPTNTTQQHLAIAITPLTPIYHPFSPSAEPNSPTISHIHTQIADLASLARLVVPQGHPWAPPRAAAGPLAPPQPQHQMPEPLVGPGGPPAASAAVNRQRPHLMGARQDRLASTTAVAGAVPNSAQAVDLVT